HRAMRRPVLYLHAAPRGQEAAFAMTAPSRDRAVAMRASAIHAGYPGVPVLHAVSIEVAAGEMLAIVGPNEAGKSTLLKVLGGSITQDAGSVELFGRP